MREKLEDIYDRTKEAIEDFSIDPINSLAFLITIVISLVAFVSGVVAYIMFIVKGGYTNQIDILKKLGLLEGYKEAFTTGTTGMIVTGVVGWILLALVVAEFIVMMIGYFMNSGKAKRVIMTVDLVVIAILVAVTGIAFYIWYEKILVSEEVYYQTMAALEGMTINMKAVFIAYISIIVVSLITFIILILITEECREMVGNMILSLLFSIALVPLFFLFLQNIIPLGTGVVSVAVVGIVLLIGFKVVAGGSAGEANTSVTSGGRNMSNHAVIEKKNGTDKTEGQKEKNKLIMKTDCVYVPRFNKFDGFKLFKVKGALGEYIESETTPFGITHRLCSVEQFEKGKFHIYESESGREIKSSEIPWRK